jgi:hypothetical protein
LCQIRLIFKVDKTFYYSTLGLSVIKKKQKKTWGGMERRKLLMHFDWSSEIALEVDSSCRLFIVPLLRGSSRFDSLI